MAKYTVDGLADKYKMWKAPAAKLLIGGKSVTESGAIVLSAEVQCGVDMASGACVISIGGVYDAKNSKFTCEDILVLGALAEVELGYIVTTKVFSGYIYSVEYCVGSDESASVTLVCMDVKAAMMGAGCLGLPGESTYKDIIEGMFKGKTARGYSELCPAPKLDGVPGMDSPVAFQTGSMDDYSFVADTARRFGLEWFVDDGKMILRKQSDAENTPLLELSGQGMIHSVEALFTTAGYLGSVTVHAVNDDERDNEKKHIKSEAKNSFKIAPDSSVAGRLIGKRAAEIFSGSAKDEKAAKELAEAHVRLRGQMSSDIAITMQGVPELKPGYYVKLDRISPKINGSLYIASVTHRFDDDGYTTTVHAVK